MSINIIWQFNVADFLLILVSAASAGVAIWQAQESKKHEEEQKRLLQKQISIRYQPLLMVLNPARDGQHHTSKIFDITNLGGTALKLKITLPSGFQIKKVTEILRIENNESKGCVIELELANSTELTFVNCEYYNRIGQVFSQKIMFDSTPVFPVETIVSA